MNTAIISGHGAWDGLNVENNLIDCGTTEGCWGTKLDSGNNSGNSPHSQKNIHVHRNWVSSASVGIGVGQAPGALIENNVVLLTGTSSFKRGITVPSEGAFGYDTTSNVTVRNNTIYMPINSVNASAIEVGENDPNGTGQVIVNNSVHTGGSLSVCFSLPLAQSAYTYVGHNACYQGNWGTTYDTTTHISENPLYASVPSDFRPLTSSPLIATGDPARAPAVDFNLRPRPASPSIGAFEP